jgi:hypothetical protein
MQSAYPLHAAWCLAPLEQVPREHCDRCGGRGSHLGSHQLKHAPSMQMRSPQQSVLVLHSLIETQHLPLSQIRLQHSVLAVQELPFGRHIGVVEVEVVLVVEVVGVVVEVEVVLVGVVEVLVEVVLVEVLVVVVVVCAWQLPLAQFLLQHWSFLVQCLPLRLHPGGSPAASPMPSDPSVPPTRAAPINLRALPRERLPSASPLASSSKKPSSLAIGCLLPQ